MKGRWYIGILLLLISSIYAGSLPAAVEVLYSTWLGSYDPDYSSYSFGLKVDSLGCAYILGITSTDDFPIINGYQPIYGGNQDVFLTKLSPSGSSLIFSTYLGGSDSEWVYGGIDLDSSRNVYVTGGTASNDFPTKNPYQGDNAGGYYDVFISKFSPSGSLLFSTYLGGNGQDIGYGLAVDSLNRVYIGGRTQSNNFPTMNAYQGTNAGNGSMDAFVAKLSSAGDSLIYSTYIGGAGVYSYENDWGYGIALDSSHHAYLVGKTQCDNFPVVNPYQSTNAGPYGENKYDAFVTKFSTSGSSLIYSTYLGGEDNEEGYGIDVDQYSCAYICGQTPDIDFPLKNAYQSSTDTSSNAYVSKFSATGSLIYSTLLTGGSSGQAARNIAVDPFEQAHVFGFTYSSTFPVKDPYQLYTGGNADAFVTKFSSSGTTLIFSTFLGGYDHDFGEDGAWPGGGIDVGTDGTVYVSSSSDSSDFPIKNAYQSSRTGYKYIVYVTRLGWQAGAPTPTPRPTPEPGTGRPEYDFNGDGTSDIGIFRGGAGLWSIKGISRIYFGSSSDLIVPGDYNGDTTTDIGIFRESSGLWAIRGVTRAYFGSSMDIPVPGDYNGDGNCEIALFRPSSGLWAVKGVTRVYYGSSCDVPVPGDYNGDGAKDIAVFRDSSGLWALRGVSRIYFGGSNDMAVPGDYNGDGFCDAGIFRGSSGLWAIRGITRSYFGGSADRPVPADYNGNSKTNIGIFRTNSGLWAVKGITRTYYGSSGDIPIPHPPGDSSGSVLYQENFSSGQAQGWNPDLSADWSVVGGEYRAYKSNPGETISMVSTYGGKIFTDFTYEVKVKRGETSGRGGGMIFRASSDYEASPVSIGDGYSFCIRSSDYYLKKTVRGSTTTLQGWTDSGHITTGWNTLKVRAVGSSLSFYINGALVKSLTDSSLSSGRIGVWGYTGTDYNNSWYFDDVLVTK